MRLTETPVSISVLHHEGPTRAVASADNMGDFWWISRVLVEPRSQRGQGVGSEMLQLIQQAVVRQGCTELRVCPGGYDNDTERQFRFYQKLGFQTFPDEPEMLFWRPEQ